MNEQVKEMLQAAHATAMKLDELADAVHAELTKLGWTDFGHIERLMVAAGTDSTLARQQRERAGGFIGDARQHFGAMSAELDFLARQVKNMADEVEAVERDRHARVRARNI